MHFFRISIHPSNLLQVRNGKKTAVLAVVIDKKSKSKGKKQEKVYVIYRPNTGAQVGLLEKKCFQRKCI